MRTSYSQARGQVFAIALLLAHSAAAMASDHSLIDPPAEIAKRVMPSVVLVTTEDAMGDAIARGSGFVVGEGIIATNRHVIRGASKASVNVVNAEEKLEVLGIVGEDEDWDLVLLAVNGLKAPPLQIGDSSAVLVGDDVYAVGNPRGLEGTFSAGIISSIRKVENGTILQITAPISPGSSGGPIVDRKGDVVGVAVASLVDGQNLNFAIPSALLSQLLEHRTDVRAFPHDVRPAANESTKPEPSPISRIIPSTPISSELAKTIRDAADAGDSGANFTIGVMLIRGWWVSADVDDGIQRLKVAADGGNADAMLTLGLLYAMDDKVEQDLDESAKWYRLAANRDSPDAMFMLGVVYSEGRGVLKSDDEALSWFRKASRAHHALAVLAFERRALGPSGGSNLIDKVNRAWKFKQYARLSTNPAFRVEPALDDLEWFENRRLDEQIEMGVMLDAAFKSAITRHFVTPGQPEASTPETFYQKATKTGDLKTMGALGACYFLGRGVSADDPESFLWFSLAAAFGDEDSRQARDLVSQRMDGKIPESTTQRMEELFDQINRIRNRDH